MFDRVYRPDPKAPTASAGQYGWTKTETGDVRYRLVLTFHHDLDNRTLSPDLWREADSLLHNFDATEEEYKALCDAITGKPLAVRLPRALTDNEYTVLRCLGKQYPHGILLDELAAQTEISRKSCGKAANSLIELGLAVRLGDRQGVGISGDGISLLKSEGQLSTP